jgi:hypothetical protein
MINQTALNLEMKQPVASHSHGLNLTHSNSITGKCPSSSPSAFQPHPIHVKSITYLKKMKLDDFNSVEIKF